MFHLFDRIYLRFRKDEIEKGKYRMKKIKLDNILQCINKECWKINIQCSVILRTNDAIILKLEGVRETILLKYHRTDMIFVEDFDRFINILKSYKVNKGVYITTGVFEAKIAKITNHFLFGNRVKLEDNFRFLKRQLGWKGKTEDTIKNNKLKFYHYLPQ